AGITANLAASGVSDVVKAFANLKPAGAPAAPGGGLTAGDLLASQQQITPDDLTALVDAMQRLRPRVLQIPAYAEISIYEPFISPEGTMEWRLLAEKSYERDVVTTDIDARTVVNMLSNASTLLRPATQPAQPGAPATQPAQPGAQGTPAAE